MNRDRDFLVDIIELIDTIQRNLPDTEKEFLEDEVLLTANIHWVQTIGEAANAVSEVVRSQHAQVPWREIVDMRNLLAHGYRHVDPAIVWQVVVRDLPGLKSEIREILDQIEGHECSSSLGTGEAGSATGHTPGLRGQCNQPTASPSRRIAARTWPGEMMKIRDGFR